MCLWLRITPFAITSSHSSRLHVLGESAVDLTIIGWIRQLNTAVTAAGCVLCNRGVVPAACLLVDYYTVLFGHCYILILSQSPDTTLGVVFGH